MYSNLGFKLAIIALLSFIVILILKMAMFHSGSENFQTMANYIMACIAVVSLVGTFNSFKGLKEPNSMKKIIGLIINFGLIVMYLIILNAKK